MEQEVKLCDELETVRESTYLGDRESASGGCEAAVTARTRCGLDKLRECSELRYGCEAWCLKESEMEILRRTERSMVRAMCGVQLKDRKRSTDLMFMLSLKETMDHLAMASCVHWYGQVLRRENGHILRRALDS